MNVILSGGGMKGAYQYGFFKKVQEIEPNFQIKKLYAVSVGSLNAVPILLKKVDLLDKHWSHPELLPFDTIVNDWPTVKSTNANYRNIQRLRAFIKNGSIFHSLNLKPCMDVLNNLTMEEMIILRQKLIIMSYDTQDQRVVFERCRSPLKTVAAIKNASLFPGLFTVDGHIIDGVNIDLNTVIEKGKPDDQWLCLDLQGYVKKNSRLCYNPRKGKTYVYSPRVVENAPLNVLSCVIASREQLDDLIDQGQNDALDFIKNLN